MWLGSTQVAFNEGEMLLVFLFFYTFFTIDFILNIEKKKLRRMELALSHILFLAKLQYWKDVTK